MNTLDYVLIGLLLLIPTIGTLHLIVYVEHLKKIVGNRRELDSLIGKLLFNRNKKGLESELKRICPDSDLVDRLFQRLSTYQALTIVVGVIVILF